mmetsp:Transcript_10367/g.28601  ORF Transcript_10367/g.28601 Transcript_10367/m.28601 type:complete len:710 (+) Transcript_10367:118-2247(+)
MAGDWTKWDVEKRALSIVDETLREVTHRYKMQEELGTGAQATVYKATHRKTARKVAIKVIELKELEDDELFDALRMEIGLLRQLSHPNVVSLREVVRDGTCVYIVQECLTGGELFDQLLAKGPFKEDYALTIFAQVVCAVDYMHSRDVVHRDLKAENLVFSAKGSPAIKFIDFGGACTCTPEQGLTGLVGTPQYVAPEVVTGFGEIRPTEEPYGKACDLWSMGVLLYVMLSKTMPFRAKQVDQLLKQVLKGRFAFAPDDRWRHVSAEAKDLITRLLCVDVSKRLTISDVRSHAWCSEAVKRYEQSLPKTAIAEPTAPSSAELKTPRSSAKTTAAYLFPKGGLRKKQSYTSPAMMSVVSATGRTTSGSAARASGGCQDRRKGTYVSKEQQYWYAMEISPPTQMQQVGGVKVSADGTFEMANVPQEMREVLEEIARQKAMSERSGSGDAAKTCGGGRGTASNSVAAANGSGCVNRVRHSWASADSASGAVSTPSSATTIGLGVNLAMGIHIPASAPPPPEGPPPPLSPRSDARATGTNGSAPPHPSSSGRSGSRGMARFTRQKSPKPSSSAEDIAKETNGGSMVGASKEGSSSDAPQRAAAEMTRLATETAAYYLHGGGAQNEAMETLALVREKDDEIASLQKMVKRPAPAIPTSLARPTHFLKRSWSIDYYVRKCGHTSNLPLGGRVCTSTLESFSASSCPSLAARSRSN